MIIGNCREKELTRTVFRYASSIVASLNRQHSVSSDTLVDIFNHHMTTTTVDHIHLLQADDTRHALTSS
jgi:hypothetical protein